MTPGHVFVVEGLIGNLVADVEVISTDDEFRVEDHWHAALGVVGRPDELEKLEPTDWRDKGWGRSRDDRKTWFLDVTPRVTNGQDRFGRLRLVLNDIADTAPKPEVKKRQLPLIALPMIGTKGGGFDAERGESIKALLDTCNEIARKSGIDVVVVVTSRSAYEALQHERRKNIGSYFDQSDLIDDAKRLGDLAAGGSLGLFIGAGASIPAGAPSWEELLKGLGDPTKRRPENFERLGPLDQAELYAGERGEEAIARHIEDLLEGKKPALAHALLASLRCQNAVTTNYDDLYEQAMAARGSRIAILPQERPDGNQPWLLKLHGDLRHPKSIVLTRRQFVRFSSISGPSGAILQSILLTKHLLVIGASMSDDNLLRLIYEVSEFRALNGGGPKTEDTFGTVLDVSANEARRQLNKRHFRWHTMPGNDVNPRARELEIFLDAVGLHAARNESWLVDPRFSALHDAAGRKVAQEVRQLCKSASSIQAQEPAWKSVVEQLRALGADRPAYD